MKLILLLISCLPSFAQKPLRRMLGAQIAAGAQISMFAFVLTRDLKMGPRARISPFVLVLVNNLYLGERAHVRPLSIFKVRRLELGDYTIVDPAVLVNCTYGPRSALKVGRHSRLQSFSIFEPSEGIEIGDHTALGGFSLVFCHGAWSNYLGGSPHARGPVKIGNEVWVSWRSMILANTQIGDRAIIGAHAMVHGRVAANGLYAGVPARQIVENAWKVLGDSERQARVDEIIAAFKQDYPGRADAKIIPWQAQPDSTAVFYAFAPPTMRYSDQVYVDLQNRVAFGDSNLGQEFIDYLTAWGVRLDRRTWNSLATV